MTTKTLKRGLLLGLVIYTVGSLVFTPFHLLKEAIVQVIPWIGAGVIVTEVLFIGGLFIMAASMGLKIRNPFKLRGELKNVLRASTATRTFWVGFWMNAFGACGSTLLLGAGIFIALPVASWGLACALFADLVVTLTIRQQALQAHARERVLS